MNWNDRCREKLTAGGDQKWCSTFRVSNRAWNKTFCKSIKKRSQRIVCEASRMLSVINRQTRFFDGVAGRFCRFLTAAAATAPPPAAAAAAALDRRCCWCSIILGGSLAAAVNSDYYKAAPPPTPIPPVHRQDLSHRSVPDSPRLANWARVAQWAKRQCMVYVYIRFRRRVHVQFSSSSACSSSTS